MNYLQNSSTSNNINSLKLPTSVNHTISNASFYQSTPTREGFERLGSGQEIDFFGTSVARTSVPIQMVFIRKVYLITLIQFLLISVMSSIFVGLSQWQEESHKNIWWIVLFPSTVLLVFTAWQLWSQYYQLSQTSRIVILSIYSILTAFILSDIGLRFSVFQEYGLLVLTMVCFGVLSQIIYSFQSKSQYKGPKPIVCSVAIICISSIELRDLYQLDPVQILAPIAISSIICMYMTLELYYAMECMTVDDYVLANLSFHMDLAYPINGLHHVCELADNADNFPEYFNPPSTID